MYEYDVALSFSGKSREYVRLIANKLKERQLKVFYDKFETANLWGKDLYQYLHYIYKECARFCVVFITSDYVQNAWPKHEFTAAQNRAFLDKTEYILPLRMEPNISLPGLPDTVGYIDVHEYSTSQIVDLIYEKVVTANTITENLQVKERLYCIVFETFNFIIDRYVTFGKGSKIVELSAIELIISEFQEFLLLYAHEINSHLFDFMVRILNELRQHIHDGEVIDLTHSVNLQFKTTALNMLRQAFEDSGFSAHFDFYNYLHNNRYFHNREEMLHDALLTIVHKLSANALHPLTIDGYLYHLAQMGAFPDCDSSVYLKTLKNTEEIKQLEELYHNSPTVPSDD